MLVLLLGEASGVPVVTSQGEPPELFCLTTNLVDSRTNTGGKARGHAEEPTRCRLSLENIRKYNFMAKISTGRRRRRLEQMRWMRIDSIVASDFLFKLWWNEAQSGIFAPLSSTQMAKYPKTNKGGAGSESAPKWKNLDAPLLTASHHPIQCFVFLLRPGLFTGKRDSNPVGFSWWSLS